MSSIVVLAVKRNGRLEDAKASFETAEQALDVLPDGLHPLAPLHVARARSEAVCSLSTPHNL